MKEFLQTIRSKKEGIFEVDLNLRPYGKQGSLAVSWDTFCDYYSVTGHAYYFERQALVRMRPITSNGPGQKLSSRVMHWRNSYVYSTIPPDFDAIKNIRKKQIAAYLKKTEELNLKYSPGGLVDIEYFTQEIQIRFGNKIPSIRETSTSKALEALELTFPDYKKRFNELLEIYHFYRNLINILRMARGNAKDLALPQPQSKEFGYLIRRCRFIGIIDHPTEETILTKTKQAMERSIQLTNETAAFLVKIKN